MTSENDKTSRTDRVNETFDTIDREMEKSKDPDAKKIMQELEKMRSKVQSAVVYDPEKIEAEMAKQRKARREFVTSIACVDGDPEKGFKTGVIKLTDQDLEVMKQAGIPIFKLGDCIQYLPGDPRYKNNIEVGLIGEIDFIYGDIEITLVIQNIKGVISYLFEFKE